MASAADPDTRAGALPDGMRPDAGPDPRVARLQRKLAALAAFSCAQGAALAEERIRADGWQTHFREFNATVASYAR